MSKPLFVFHVDHPRPGLLADWAQLHFGGFDTCFSHKEDLPNLSKVSGPIVVFGGPMGVADIPQLDWLAKEAQWVQEALTRKHPILGICLGAQLMGHTLGHRVTSCPQKTLECGYHPVQSNGRLPTHVYHWHRDGVVLGTPNQVECLGRSAWMQGKATQAFVHHQALGVQFHPEVTQEVIKAWVERDYKDTLLEGARPAETHLVDHEVYGEGVANWLDATLKSMWGIGLHRGDQDGKAEDGRI